MSIIPSNLEGQYSAQELLWSQARASLATTLSQDTYKIWIEPLQSKWSNGHLILEAPNQFFLGWVKSHFTNDIKTAVTESGQELGLEGFNIEFAETHQTSEMPAETYPQDKPMMGFNGYKGIEPLHFNPNFTFDNFVVGTPNLLAYSAAKAMSAGESFGTDILFITSDPGLGKSHLSQAMGQSFLKTAPHSHIYYLTAEEFTNEMVQSIHNRTMEDFKHKYRTKCDILVLEEVNFLAGKEKIQGELCFTLDHLLENGKKIVLTSSTEPKSIPRLGRSFKSRLSSALITPIGAPDYETRLAILKRKAENKGLKISRPIMELLASQIQNDVRQLESCLISLTAKSHLLNKAVDLDMARDCLSFISDTAENELSLNKVRGIICYNFHLEEDELKSKSRKRNINEARAMGMYLARLLTKRTLEEIGEAFGRKHSTALYAITKLEQQLRKDSKLMSKIEFLTNQLNN